MNTQVADGPLDIAPSFVWQGESYYDMPRKAQLLVSALWNVPAKALTDEELAGPVWGDPDLIITRNQLASVGREANRFFKKHSIPVRVSTMYDLEPRLLAMLQLIKPGDSDE